MYVAIQVCNKPPLHVGTICLHNNDFFFISSYQDTTKATLITHTIIVLMIKSYKTAWTWLAITWMTKKKKKKIACFDHMLSLHKRCLYQLKHLLFLHHVCLPAHLLPHCSAPYIWLNPQLKHSFRGLDSNSNDEWHGWRQSHDCSFMTSSS